MADLQVLAALEAASVAATASQARASGLSYTGGLPGSGKDEAPVRGIYHACGNTCHSVLSKICSSSSGGCEEMAGKTLTGEGIQCTEGWLGQKLDA